ncbi:hypothetical protein EJB05_15671, partial [Eragrostis curvula]
MAPLKRFLLVVAFAALVAAETDVLVAAREMKPSEPMMNSAAPFSDKKLYFAPRVPLFIPPRLPPSKIRARGDARAP